MGSCSSLLTQPPLSSPALLPLESLPSSDLCAFCIIQNGLCGRDDCRRQVLPQLARPTGLLRLMGEARIEQKSRQTESEISVSVEQADWRVRKEQARNQSRAKARKHARSVARSQRRGNFGLAQSIAGLTP